MVKNGFGVEIDYEAAVNLMDDDIREELHASILPCTDQEFFDAYAEVHYERFGVVWECDKENPYI